MKFKTNISALLLALLVFVSGNGIALFEHICNTSKSSSFCVFTQPKCENEKPTSSCCKKSGTKEKKGCCEHKEFYSKLNIEGFTAKQFQLIKLLEQEVNFKYLSFDFSYFSTQIFKDHYSGIPPPDNLHTIKYLLRPTSSGLQVFRC